MTKVEYLSLLPRMGEDSSIYKERNEGEEILRELL